MIGARARRVHLEILLIILLAFGLRLYAIDRQDLWGDEAFSVWLSSQPLPEVVAGGADTHPPLYPFLLYLWLHLAGSSPFAVRSLSALIGVLTVPCVYVLGRRAFGQASGTLAGLLAAASPILIYYSQETRMYGLVTLLAAASVYWAMRIYRQPRSLGAWSGYLLATLAAAYTHYYAFFVILAEDLVLLFFLLRQRQRVALGRWLAGQGVVALAYLPWIAVQSGFLGGKVSTRFAEWNLTTALRIAGETVRAFSAGLGALPAVAWVAAALFLTAIGAGLWVAMDRQRAEAWLIAAYLVLPLALAWIVNPIMPFFYPRYLLLLVPGFYVLAAAGIMVWGRLWRPAAALLLTVLFIGSAYGLQGYYFGQAGVKGRYGQMMAYIQAHALPGDAIILANQLQRPIFEYYRPQNMEAYFLPHYEYPLEDPRTEQELEDMAARHPRLWLVRFGNPGEYDPDAYLLRWLASHGSKAYFGGWVDADLSLYVMAPAAVSAGSAQIQHPLRADLGDQVRLLGYSLNQAQVAPGETLLLTLYWQSLAPMAERYTVFTHLLDSAQQIEAQMDSEPQGGGLPTDRWTAGQMVQDNYALIVPGQAKAGSYTLEAGMYLLATMERLPVRDADTGASLGDRVILGSIEVVTR
jgi:mannosyltransferase